MLERSITPLGLRKLLRDHAVSDQFWYGLNRFRRITPSRTGGENVVDMLRRAVEAFEPIRSAPVVVGEVHPVGSITAALPMLFRDIYTGNSARSPLKDSNSGGDRHEAN